MTAPPRPAISIHGLTKTFGDRQVLAGIDLDITAGTVFSLLGPNGAGKTTMVRILTTSTTADQGTIRIGGHDLAAEPDRVRDNIGVTGQYSAVDKVLTGTENLRLIGRLLHLDRAVVRQRTAELLERFDLGDAADRPARTYSGGMRRRLDLAMSLMGQPRIVFLDEPTTGLDPRSRRELWQVIRELVDDGITIFLTTQYLEEADQLADRIAVLHDGHIVADGTAAELKQLTPGGHIRLRFADVYAMQAAALATGRGEADPSELTLQVPSDGSVGDLKRLLDHLENCDISVEQLTVHTPDLDDVFFALTSRPSDRIPA
ncbi:ATP-binding cassette domain-containing protein [Nocardia donostiensis]|uniref:ABC transporter n=1 Tax=Nocardia donostiensis TaxID=1538463 RepID=A0A1V2TCS1_9NOCA|nr:ATP-binding cassette domain-containing protein [Nocardia donostiensis]ONM47307.1 ABC transporter [Nocardia donostiensis]OQS16609.1 ABC transporter [Nocardia donostiensis]OQS21086.1 ABC transporter [Nocardia donostiensis]